MTTSTAMNVTLAQDLREMLAEVRKLNQAIGSLEQRLALMMTGIEPAARDNALAEANSLIASPLAEALDSQLAESDPAADDDAALAEALELGEPAPDDDFTKIEGIDDKIAEILRGLGLTHFKDIAAFNEEDVMLVGEAIGNSTQVTDQKWIKQASVLAGWEKADDAGQAVETKPAVPAADKTVDDVLLPTKVVPATEIDARRRKRGDGWSRRIGSAASLAAAATGLMLVIQLQQQLPFSTIAKDLALPMNFQTAFADAD